MAMAIKWNLVRYKGQGNIKVINRRKNHYQLNNTKYYSLFAKDEVIYSRNIGNVKY